MVPKLFMDGVPGDLRRGHYNQSSRWYSNFSEHGSPRPSAARLDGLGGQIINHLRMDSEAWTVTVAVIIRIARVADPRGQIHRHCHGPY